MIRAGQIKAHDSGAELPVRRAKAGRTRVDQWQGGVSQLPSAKLLYTLLYLYPSRDLVVIATFVTAWKSGAVVTELATGFPHKPKPSSYGIFENWTLASLWIMAGTKHVTCCYVEHSTFWPVH